MFLVDNIELCVIVSCIDQVHKRNGTMLTHAVVNMTVVQRKYNVCYTYVAEKQHPSPQVPFLYFCILWFKLMSQMGKFLWEIQYIFLWESLLQQDHTIQPK